MRSYMMVVALLMAAARQTVARTIFRHVRLLPDSPLSDAR
jgi:hypothetical protein